MSLSLPFPSLTHMGTACRGSLNNNTQSIRTCNTMIFHTKGCANEALRKDEFRGIQSCIFLSSVLNYSVKTFCFGVLTGLDNSITIRYFKAQLCKREHFESKMWHCDHNGNSSSVENHFSGTVYSKLKTIAVVTPLHKIICVCVVCISVHAHKCVCG